MTAGDLVVTLAAVMATIGFAALVVVLAKVLDAVREMRAEVASLRSETRPLLDEMRSTTIAAQSTMETARSDLERFDRVLGSAEAVSDAVEHSGHQARRVFSAPVIKAAGVVAGTRRAVQRFRKTDPRPQLIEPTLAEMAASDDVRRPV